MLIYNHGLQLLLFSLCVFTQTLSQCPTNIQIDSEVELSEGKYAKDIETRIKKLYAFKQQFEECRLEKDSIFAKILHKIGIIEYMRNGYVPTENSFLFTAEAIRINLSGIKNSSPAYATKSFSNLGVIYMASGLYKEAARFSDSTIKYARLYPEYRSFNADARVRKAEIYFQMGDYQRAIDEASLGIAETLSSGDSMKAAKLFNKRAESRKLQGNKEMAMKDAVRNIKWIESVLPERKKNLALNSAGLNDYYRELSIAYKVKALCFDEVKSNAELKHIMNISNYYLSKTLDSGRLSRNFNDFGVYYLNTFNDHVNARINFLEAIKYDKNSKWALAFGYLNLGAADYLKGDLNGAEKQYLKMLSLIGLPARSIFENQPMAQLMAVPFRQLIHVFLTNKTELLLALYKKSEDRRYLDACLVTAVITDSVILEMRREQSAEQSKLFWRNKTRSFFTNALEASYLAKNYPLAFYFMEKSRAMILADRLIELDASSKLPASETIRERLLIKDIESEENRLRVLQPNTGGYDSVMTKLFEARYRRNNFMSELENKYPEYYRYKFSNESISYNQFKNYLAQKNSGFVSYFVGDTASYILAISGNNNDRMLKIPAASYDRKKLEQLLLFLSDGVLQNRNYDSLIKQASEFYVKMFAGLGVAKGHVIICPDGFILPFDALPVDGKGTRKLLDDYSFSYVYSANTLLSKFKPATGIQNFVGFAPAVFNTDMKLAPLYSSTDFLEEAGSSYSSSKLFTGPESNRSNFLSNLGSYQIVNVFSHASTGNGDEEPILYMADSIIHLSELQSLTNLCTELVVLSACQTSAGKNAVGEGIYSLSRGFAAAGIPSVMATIWRADEHPVYRISVLFHKYIAEGMRKDDALRLAKIQYLKNADTEKSLPYYWSNMVIMGNTDSITLAPKIYSAWVAGGFVVFLLAAWFAVAGYRSGRKKDPLTAVQ